LIPTIRGFPVAQVTVAFTREASLQRLFTTFAGGWPGFGLLVQRLVTGIVQLHNAMELFKEALTVATIAPQVIGAILGIFIVIGLWTPLAGALMAAVEVWTLLVHPGNPGTAILLAMIGVTLAMIGPGGFSIDARLFGRKHFGN
jgi:putative oxidoreductase